MKIEINLDLYNIIAEHYSKIFPLDPDRISFVRSFLNKGDRLLDIGCATGDFCLELVKADVGVYGIDLNKKMIDIAQEKVKTKNVKCNFKVMDMMNIINYFDNGYFSLITCFGNTLPHLDSLKDVKIFFNQVYTLLNSKGSFILQILNYDKIMSNRVVDFPLINNPDFVFRRKYDFFKNRIRFIVTMEYKNKSYTDFTLLLPLKKEFFILELEAAGFKGVKCYTDYQLNHSTGKEFSTLYVAEK